MDDDDFLLGSRAAVKDPSGKGTCGGSVDERCSKPVAWRVIRRPGGGTSYRGYCARHAARLIRADEHAAEFTQRSQYLRS